MGVNKRGQLYSLLVLLILVPLLLFITVFIVSFQEIKFGATEKVLADQANTVQRSIEKDFINAVRISTRRAFLGAVNDVVTNGTYLSDSHSDLRELMQNGTIRERDSFPMENNTLPEWEDNILAIDVGFNRLIAYTTPSFLNIGGFRVNTSINITVNISDTGGLINISRGGNHNVTASIEALEDPVYFLETSGRVSRSIVRYTYPFYSRKIVTGTSTADCEGEATFDNLTLDGTKILVTQNGSGVSGYRGVVAEFGVPSLSCYLTNADDAVDKVNDTINEANYSTIYIDNKTNAVWSLPIKFGIENGHYYPEIGPNIFMRLEGNLAESADGLGLETFVHIPDLQDAEVPVKSDESLVDYKYFADQHYTGESVRGLQGWFRIDNTSASIYGLGELLET